MLPGDFVYVDVNGYLVLCADADPIIMGMLLEPSHNLGQGHCGDYWLPVAIATENTIYSLCIHHAANATEFIAATDMQVAYNTVRHAAGMWVADKDNAGDPVRIVRFIDPLGTIQGRVGCIVTSPHRQIS